MNVLVVADEHPWPARTGYRQRVERTVRALADEYDVDLLTVVPDDRLIEPPPEDLRLRRHWTVVAGSRAKSRRHRQARWLVGRVPRTLGWRDWTSARDVLDGVRDTAYDVVWFSHANTWLALADSVPGPHVTDLDNLDSQMLRHRRRMHWRTRSTHWRGRARSLAQLVLDTMDIRRWRRIEQRIVEQSASVIVCSALDRDRLGAGNVRVIPNAYERFGDHSPRAGSGTTPGRAPVLLMVGLLTYEPNRDAAGFFAAEVLPLIRQSRPEAVFRVVGRYDEESNVATFRDLPGVSVAGEVPDITPELEGADVAVVPIRFGGGTRIKILEAFAHRIPVASTTIGAEGLEVEDGRHLLLADAPEELARASLRLLDDDVLRSTLVAEGEALWEARYRSSVVGRAIADTVEDVVKR